MIGDVPLSGNGPKTNCVELVSVYFGNNFLGVPSWINHKKYGIISFPVLLPTSVLL